MEFSVGSVPAGLEPPSSVSEASSPAPVSARRLLSLSRTFLGSSMARSNAWNGKAFEKIAPPTGDVKTRAANRVCWETRGLTRRAEVSWKQRELAEDRVREKQALSGQANA